MRNSGFGYRKKKRSGGTLWLMILAGLLGAGAYVFTAKDFERNKPIVKSLGRIKIYIFE